MLPAVAISLITVWRCATGTTAVFAVCPLPPPPTPLSLRPRVASKEATASSRSCRSFFLLLVLLASFSGSTSTTDTTTPLMVMVTCGGGEGAYTATSPCRRDFPTHSHFILPSVARALVWLGTGLSRYSLVAGMISSRVGVAAGVVAQAGSFEPTNTQIFLHTVISSCLGRVSSP